MALRVGGLIYATIQDMVAHGSNFSSLIHHTITVLISSINVILRDVAAGAVIIIEAGGLVFDP